MMRQETGLPPLAVGQAYNFQLFNALVKACAGEKLGFPAQEVATSGKNMLTALKSALQYVLKFDDAGVLKQKHCRLPRGHGHITNPIFFRCAAYKCR
eukprot:scaffold9513_cov84-Phaeocystis_antarctica.AAC.3